MKTTTLDREIRSRIDAFTNDLAQTIKLATLRAVHASLGEAVDGRTSAPAPVATAAPVARRRGRAGRRSPEDVAKTGELFLAHVQRNGGQRLEQIAKELGVPTKELTYPVTRLMEAKKLKTKGQKRGTMYFAR